VAKLKLYPIIIFFFILSIAISCDNSTNPLESSTGWYMQREQQDDITYYSIFFSDENNGWIVGYSGTIRYSSDGGETWKSQQSGVSSNLWDVFFIDNQKGWACGADHTILRTLDGGDTWNNVSPHDTTDKIFLSLKFVSDEIGWAASNHGELLKSMDGGLSWELNKIFRPMGFHLIVFDPNTVYALQGRLYRTFDSGETWDSLRVAYPENYAPTGMFFSDIDHGWIPTWNGTGGQIILYYPVIITTDGGMTWFLSDSIECGGLRCSYFINEDIGWLSSSYKVYKTINGGIHWTSEFFSKNTLLNAKDMFFINENLGWLLSYEGNIYKYVGPAL